MAQPVGKLTFIDEPATQPVGKLTFLDDEGEEGQESPLKPVGKLTFVDEPLPTTQPVGRLTLVEDSQAAPESTFSRQPISDDTLARLKGFGRLAAGPGPALAIPAVEEVGKRLFATPAQLVGVATRTVGALAGTGQKPEFFKSLFKGAIKGESLQVEDLFTPEGLARFRRQQRKQAELAEKLPSFLRPFGKPLFGPRGITEAVNVLSGFMPLGRLAGGALSKTAGAVSKRLSPFASDKVIVKGEAAKAPRTIDDLVFDLRREMVDRFAAVQDFEKDVIRVGGKPITADESAFIAFRNQAGIGGKLETVTDDFKSLLQGLDSANLDDLSRYLVAKRDFHIAGQKGLGTSVQGQKALKDLLLLKRKYGENFPVIEKAAEKIYEFNKQSLYKKVRAGLVDSRDAQKLIASEPFYYPIEVVKYKDKTLGRFFGRSKQPQDTIKALVGRKEGEKIFDPVESSLRHGFDAEIQAQRNQAMQKLISFRERGGGLEDIIFPIKADEKIAEGFDKVRVFQKGREQLFGVPGEIASAIKGLDEVQSNFLSKMVARTTGLFRAGTTGSNLLFIVPNAIRDFMTASLTEGITPADWARALQENAKALAGVKVKSLQEFKEAGGAFGGLGGQIRSLDLQSRLIRGAVKTRKARFIETVTSPKELIRKPFDMINRFSEAIENTPRLAVFEKVRRQGGSPTEAAFRAREATVDFSKMGNSMRLFNMMVPFVNARLQGNLNVLKALGRGTLSKQEGARVAAVLGAYAVAPTLAVYASNRAFYGDLYDDVPEATKRNYFVLLIGSKIDENGDRQPVGIKIPKPEAVQIFSNPLETMIDNLYREKRLDVQKLAIETIGTLSPVEIEHKGKLSATKMIGSVLPPFAKAPVEAGLNKSFFTMRPVEQEFINKVKTEDIPQGERFTERTTEFAKALGKAIGYSPIKIDHLVRGTLGQVGSFITEPKQFLTQGKGRFVLERGGQKKQEEFDLISEAKQEGGLARLMANRRVKELMDNPELRGPQILKELEKDPLLLNQLKTAIKTQLANQDSVERSLANLPIKDGTQAAAIIKILRSVPENQVPQKFLDLISKKIISKDGFKQFVLEAVRKDPDLLPMLKVQQ